MNFFLMLFIISLAKLLKSDSMLIVIISLEMMSVSVMFLFSICMYQIIIHSTMVIVFITIMVVEGILGVTMMVSLSRQMGNDQIKSNSTLKF